MKISKEVDDWTELSWQNATTSEVIFVIESLLQWLHLSSAMGRHQLFFWNFENFWKNLKNIKILKISKSVWQNLFEFFKKLKFPKFLNFSKILNVSKFFWIFQNFWKFQKKVDNLWALSWQKLQHLKWYSLQNPSFSGCT